jgi:Na+/proline symporter
MEYIAIICLSIYTLLLFAVMFFTARKAGNDAYFIGNRRSPWFVVAYGMIGASLSGVTLLSVPGDVSKTQFTYFAIVLGYVLGYIVIAKILLPLYYRLHLTSIYAYLEQRFGVFSYKTGSFFFIVSRLLGSALRMYLVIFILNEFVFSRLGVPLYLTAIVFVLIIFAYTFLGGIKTVVWTDTLQTTFLLAALVMIMFLITDSMNMSVGEMLQEMKEKEYTRIFDADWRSSTFFVKQILAGMFITIAMTGLDQDMMQKNLSCKNIKAAQRNMFSFTLILVVANALFLLLGGMLCVYAVDSGWDLASFPQTDNLLPSIALNHLSMIAGITFVLGLIAAGYSSADGTLTSLTTVVCIDFLSLNKYATAEKQKIRIRRIVHLLMSGLFLGIILIFSRYHSDALIRILFKVASYTYGPLLGLYSFGMFTKRKLQYEFLVPIIAILCPLICYFVNMYSKELLQGYVFGFELLLLNGLLVFIGLFVISRKRNSER